jgi:hypothetical protein
MPVSAREEGLPELFLGLSLKGCLPALRGRLENG